MHVRRATAAFALAVAFGLTAWDDRDDAFINNRRNFWSFQKVARPAVPSLTDPWIRTPVDAFLLEAMREKKLAPSPPAAREKLVRRVTLDLTGLPPTPGEVDAFLKDRSAAAFENLVDRLMASPQYGERWAQRWLDVVRYADTNGYEIDAERPHAWRYRDYVVRSFQTNKPFDRFVKEQIAGDELFPGDHEALIATGFHRAGPIHLVAGNQDEEMNRQEVLTEMAGAIGSVFLGITVGCARCHNHKFDPILQSDYYRLQAVFAATEGRDIEIASAAEKDAFTNAKAEHEARRKPVAEEIRSLEKPYRAAIEAEKRARLNPRQIAAMAKPKEQRSEEEKILAKEAEDLTEVLWDELVARIPEPLRSRRAELRRRLHDIDLDEPQPPATAYAVANMAEAPASHILKGGDHRHKLNRVDAGLPKVLTAPDAAFPQSVSGRRAALARWLVSPDHPLTARVMVNRIWQFRMGAGLVGTPNDFGALGKRPSNRKLLDWLAAEFVASGWDIRKLDRLIVTSAAYRQSTATVAANVAIDGENRYFWRANRRRMDAEQIRDSILAVTGKLNLKAGGPPVRVPIEKEVYDLIFTEFEPDNLWPLPRDVSERYRRSLYLLNKRTVRLPMLANFDQPDAMTSCPERPVSTHALQALNGINSDFMQEQAAAFASRLEQRCRGGAACIVPEAHRLALSRSPSPAEQKLSADFLARGGTVADFALAMLNRNEFVYLP